jgi:phage protein D
MTAELRTVVDASTRFGGFYVPRFEVRIAGAGLPDDVLRDVKELTYSDDIDQLDSFQLVVNNWDPERREFKFIGSETEQTLRGGSLSARFTLFEPCNKEVNVSMGYGSELRLMLTGTFTTMEPNFSSGGAPLLTVRGLNLLHQFRRKRYDDAFLARKDSQIAQDVTQRQDEELRAPRFPIGLRTDERALADEEAIEFVAQRNEYDIDFLWKRARMRGYVLVLEEQTNEHPRRLYFGPSEESGGRICYRLEWGKSVIDLTPRLTTANQFRSVTVRGWDRGSQRPISKTVDLTHRELARLNPDLHEMIRQCDPREELVVEEPVFTEREAETRAIALLLDQHKQMCTVHGSTVGLPELRAGANVEILGVGSRLSGTYFVTKSTHVINDSGYTTTFDARREQRGAAGSEAA